MGRGGSNFRPAQQPHQGQREAPRDGGRLPAGAASADTMQLLRQLQARIKQLESQGSGPSNAVRRFGDRVDRAAGDQPNRQRNPRETDFADRRTRFGQGLVRGRSNDDERRRTDFGSRRRDEPRRGARTTDDWEEGRESFNKRRRQEQPTDRRPQEPGPRDYYPPLRVHVRR